MSGCPEMSQHDYEMAVYRERKALESPDYRARCAAKAALDLPMTRSERRQARKILKPTGQPWKLHGYQVKKEPGSKRADPRQTMMRQDTLERSAKAIGL